MDYLYVIAAYQIPVLFGHIWTILLLPASIFGFRLYKISEGPKTTLALKRLRGRGTVTKDDENTRGWIYGRWYVGYVDDVERYPNVWIFATSKFYYSLIHEVAEETPKNIVVRLLMSMGSYADINYLSRDFNLSGYEPRENQKKPLRLMVNYYLEHRNLVVLVHGPPNCGKSMLAILLAKELKANFGPMFDPTEPGSSIFDIYSTMPPDQNAPMLLTFEEFDVTMTRIHHGIKPNKNISIRMRDKSSYNASMDMIDHGLYPHLIIFMTSNHGPDYFNEMDSSYIRKGRVNMIISME